MYSARKTKNKKMLLKKNPIHQKLPLGRIASGMLMTKVVKVGRNHHWKVDRPCRAGCPRSNQSMPVALRQAVSSPMIVLRSKGNESKKPGSCSSKLNLGDGIIRVN